MSTNPTTTEIYATTLDHRGVVAVGGADRRNFLQGLISQDVEKIDASHAAYGALLTPQGKFLHEFCIIESGDRLLLECERDRAADLVIRLSRFRLRAKVDVEDVSGSHQVGVVFSPLAPPLAASLLGLEAMAGAATDLAYVDPRLADLGCRMILVEGADLPAAKAASLADYDAWRLELGVADGARDMEIEKTTLLEANFDALNGVDWEKGCYMGQEITARTHYRGLVKRRYISILFNGTAPVNGTAPALGTQIMADGDPIGSVRSTAKNRGLAHMRIDALGSSLTAEEAGVVATVPNWLKPFID